MTVQVSDGTLTDTQAIAVTVTAVNDNNPVITSNGGGATAAISIAENTTAVTTVTATDADLPAQTLTYSITGGADAARFTINSSTGVLSFVAAPDFEAPDGRRGEQRLRRHGAGQRRHATDTQAIAVTVTAVNDNSPVITSNGGGADRGRQHRREHDGRDHRHRDRRRPAGTDADLLDQRRRGRGQVHDRRSTACLSFVRAPELRDARPTPAATTSTTSPSRSATAR